MENLNYDDYMAGGFIDVEEPRYEIIEGVKMFISPSPNFGHGSIVSNLVTIFNNYFWNHKSAGRVIGDNIDVHLPDGNLFMPDLTVVCDLNIIKLNDTIYGVPDLVVEILSRSTMNKDLGAKKLIYERNGVKEYWIVNQWIKSVEVYHLIDGKFNLDNVYQICPQQELERMTEEERSEIKTKIKVSIFEDLIVDLDKVFMWIE